MEISFQLSPAQPRFTYSFVPPESAAYTAAARWDARDALQVSVQASGSTRPTVQSGVSPVGVGFTAPKGQTCTITVGPRQGVVQTEGQLAILSGSARKVFKPPATQGGRLEAALARSESKDAFLPIIAQLAERYLNDAGGGNELDQLFQEGLAKYPRVNRELLTAFVRDMKAVPSNVQQRAFTPTALGMQPMAPVTAANVADALRSTGVAGIQTPAQAGVSAATLLPREMLPRIDSLAPGAGTQGYARGQAVTIVGSGFSAIAADNQIQILAFGATNPSFTLQPQSVTPSRLTFSVPGSIAAGSWRLKVRVTLRLQGAATGAGTAAVQPATRMATARRQPQPARRVGSAQPVGPSTPLQASLFQQLRPSGTVEIHLTNEVPLGIQQPPAPAPVITSISPAGQEPSQWVTINGQNFAPGAQHFVIMQCLDFAQPTSWMVEGQATSSTQLRVQLRSNQIAGDYAFQVFVAERPMSDTFDYTVAAPRYRIVFDRMECIDESNPEWWGSDEIVTFWVVAADGHVWSKNTDEYGGFDDGDSATYRASDQNVLLPSGGYRQAQHGLFLVTELYEWDVGDVSAAQDFIGLVGHVAAGMAAVTLGLPIAAIIEAVAWVLQEIIGAVVSWFGGDPDHLGTSELAFPYYMLQGLVNPGATVSRQITFSNSGSTGSYRLYYRIMRAN